MPRSFIRIALAFVLVALPACGGGGGDNGGVTNPPPAIGIIAGTVSAGGSGIESAQVALSGRGSQTTNASGQYTFTNVPTGSHTLTLTVPSGYELDSGQTTSKTTTVVANQTATVNWSLRQNNPPQTQVDTVRLIGTSFEPQNLTVRPGRTVVWVNTETVFHTVTPDGHSQWTRATTSSTGEVMRVTFNTVGNYNYYCEPHRSSGMTGRITVQQ